LAHQVTVEGIQYKSISEAARYYGFAASKVSARLALSWTIEEALEIAPRARTNSMGRPILVNGVQYAKIKNAAEEYGFSGRFIANRLNLGLTPEQALEIAPFPEWFAPGINQKRVQDAERRCFKEIQTGIKQCSTCKKEKSLSSFHGSHDNSNISSRCQDCVSASFLKYRYKMSVEQFNEIRERQNDCCAICQVKLEIKQGSTFRSKNAVVDHCHRTGNVRGLLCSACNKGLGHFRDDLTLLRSAIAYLSTPERQTNEEM
jgi:hypothetical protein